MFTRAPFITALGLNLIEWDDDEVVVRMPYRPDLTNGQDTCHGGALATLVDTAGAAAVWAGHDYAKGIRNGTVSMAINYIGSSGQEATIARARCIHRGSQLNFVEIRLERETEGRLVAHGTLTYRITH